jgi:hypothetical protein
MEAQPRCVVTIRFPRGGIAQVQLEAPPEPGASIHWAGHEWAVVDIQYHVEVEPTEPEAGRGLTPRAVDASDE